ncbi:hypothetical protein F444_19697 [Phytophthora nicotianae P1976]|nr:hypothetical protein F444_19697 [Phytophthora nicotianae P1976]
MEMDFITATIIEVITPVIPKGLQCDIKGNNDEKAFASRRTSINSNQFSTGNTILRCNTAPKMSQETLPVVQAVNPSLWLCREVKDSSQLSPLVQDA